MKPIFFSGLCSIILFVILLTNCKKDKPVTPADTLPVVTKSVTVYPDGGATLNGQFNQVPANITEYGFMLSSDSLFTYQQRFKVTGPATLGAFKFDITAGLQKNTKYYVRAYTIVNGGPDIVSYNVVYFNSSGSKKVMVSSVLPLKADIGDTITIKGKYFLGQYLSVVFGGAYAPTTVLNDSVITCTVPINLTKVNPVVTINYNTTIDTATTNFLLNTPVITGFATQATFRDTIVITGNYFGYQNTLNQVSIGNAVATVISSSRTQLKVIVPDNVPHSFNNINITAQLQTVASATQFQIRQPVITSVTPGAASVNDPVIITGKYFHPVISNNTVYSENNQAQLTGGSTTKLTYNIPNGPYPRRKATIKIKMLDYTITYSPDMVIQDKWIIVGKVPFNDYGAPGAFTINNASYAIAGSQDYTNNQLYLWKFNPSNFSWTQISLPFTCTNGIVTATASKAYLYTISATNNFWEFDPASNTWTEKADYPAGMRQYGTMFAVGSKVYFGLGSSSQSYGNPDTDDTFYQYNTSTNSWTQVASYPDPQYYGLRNLASAFVVNNIAYVGCGATNTGMYKFYAYSPVKNSWYGIADFPDVRAYTTGFSFGGYGFISNGSWGTPTHDCFKYDPTANTWTHLNDYIGCNACGWGIERGYAFVNNGNVYVGGGNSSSSTFYLYQAAGSGL